MLLLLIYVGFVSGTGPVRGLLRLPVQDGLYVRAAMLLAAAWLAVLALPLLFVAHRLPQAGVTAPPDGHFGWLPQAMGRGRRRRRGDRNLIYFLVASALFRDGLAAIFAFGAVLGVNVYGLSQAHGARVRAAASLVAAVGAAVGGFVDHRVGSKPVIVASLAAIIVGPSSTVSSGAHAFWLCGLLLCVFIGPSLSSARALLLHMAKHGSERVANPASPRREGRCRSWHRGCSPSSSMDSAPFAPASVGSRWC